jgi:hypothetical protein
MWTWDEVLAATFSLVAPHLTERQRRLLLGAAARALGYGWGQPGRAPGRGVAADSASWRDRA